MKHLSGVGNDALTIPVRGDLLSTKIDEVNALIEAAFRSVDPDRNPFVLRIDLKEARMIDSAGLNLLVGWVKRLDKAGGKLQIVYSNPNVLRIITFTRLDRHVGMVRLDSLC